MTEYKVTIEFYGVLKQIRVKASTKGEALNLVKEKMWSKTRVDIEELPYDESIEFLKSMFGMR